MLELHPLPLHQQICQFGDRQRQQGIDRIQLLPLFLLPGVHVMEDIPAEVERAQQSLGSDMVLDVRPHLGTHAGLASLLAARLQPETAVETWILLSHGSRRPGGNQPVETLAAQLARQLSQPAIAAYWSVMPDLESQVTRRIEAGDRAIGIVPYCLFKGGICEAIASEIDRLSQDHPSVRLHLADPIGASDRLARLAIDLLDGRDRP